jgi:putative endonuclease
MAAEKIAAEFLSRAGFKILHANYTCKGGELDLVADDDGTVVFVEVRARSSSDHGAPEETIGALKRRRLVHAATHYLTAQKLDDRPCRFDVVAIDDERITHLRDAFTTTD